MPDASPTVGLDFSAQMQALVIEAEQVLGEKAQKATDKRHDASTGAASSASVAQLIRPVLLGVESLMRTQASQAELLERLEKALGVHAGVPDLLQEARQSLDQRNGVNRTMFEALHEELKRYREDFYLETIVRPVVRDLVSLYDDGREIQRQVASIGADAGGSAAGFGTLYSNMEHHLVYFLEVLERMEVRLAPPGIGKLDRRTQRAVAREPAETEEEDLLVVRSVRPGFTWRNRLFRAEEVVVKKWGISVAAADDGDSQDPPTA